MALGITINRDVHRYDSETFPEITFVDLTADISVLKLSDWFYIPFEGEVDPFTIQLPNRTIKECVLALRQFIEAPAFTLDTGISQVGNVLSRGSGEGYNGASYGTALSATKCSVQAKADTTNLSAGISLQNGDQAIVHNYAMANAVHSITLGQDGLGSIREVGSLVAASPHFRYEVGDMVMIELDNGIVRYYLVKPDDSMTLLRTTRSKLTAAPKAEFLLYFTGSTLNDVLLFDDDEATTTIELVGALEDFQDWQNDFFHQSTADGIELANGDMEFTFANSKTRRKNLTPNLNVRTKAQRDDFLDFFNHHGIEKNFILVDNAHTDRDKNPTEFWAKFTAPFGDKARASCLSMHATQITESYRSDIVIKHLDNGNLTVLITTPELPFEYDDDLTLFGSFTHTDDGRLERIEVYVDDELYIADYEIEPFRPTFSFTIKYSDFALGMHDVYVIGYSFGNKVDQSGTFSFEFVT